jgi:hypothetical protein
MRLMVGVLVLKPREAMTAGDERAIERANDSLGIEKNSESGWA